MLAEKSVVRWGEWEALGGVLASAPRVASVVSSLWLGVAVSRGADKSMWLRQQGRWASHSRPGRAAVQ